MSGKNTECHCTNARRSAVHLLSIATLMFVTAISSVAFGQANDDCINAIPIVDGPNSFDTGAAPTLDPTAPAQCDTNLDADVWYVYEATCDGTITFDTCDSTTPGDNTGPDTVMEVFTGVCGGLTSVGCGDDNGCGVNGYSSIVSVPGVATQLFYVRLSEYDANAQVTGLLTVTCIPTPANDNCDGALEVFTGANSLGSNCNASPIDDREVSCQTISNKDVFYYWVADCTGLATIDTLGSLFEPVNDTVLTIYENDCFSDELVCDDDGVEDPDPTLLSTASFAVTSGTTYIIRVAGYSDRCGDISLNISCLPAGGPEACCFGGNTPCAELLPGDCASMSGVSQGAFTTCAETICPGDGACCLPDGTCVNVLDGQPECDVVAGGPGFYQGDGTDCATTSCPQPGEACDTAVVINSVPFSQNADWSGTSDGPGGSCDPFAPVTFMSGDLWFQYTATEDCVLRITVTPDGSITAFDPITVIRDNCDALTELLCDDDSGANTPEVTEYTVFTGQTVYIQTGDHGGANDGSPGTILVECLDPNSVQACCNPNATDPLMACSDLDPMSCGSLGGVPLGLGTTCAIDGGQCVGACCFASVDPIDACELRAPIDCSNSLGTFLGDGTTCAVEGAECVGACCYDTANPVDACQDQSEGNCLSTGGTYLGGGTSCAADGAGCVGACCDAPGGCVVTTNNECFTLTFGPTQGLGTTCGLCPPVNDSCATATAVDCNTGTIAGLSLDGALPDHSPVAEGSCTDGYAAVGPDVVFSFTPTSDIQVTAGMFNTNFDASFYVVTDCNDPNLTCVAGEDDGGDEFVTFGAQMGVTYFMICDAYLAEPSAGTSFDFVISCQETCDSCPGDVNGDESVNGLDIQAFTDCYLSEFGLAPSAGCACADVEDDNVIDENDLTALVDVLLNGTGLCFPDCGASGAGSCFDPAGNGSPGCDDRACCLIVCNEDAFCCDTEFDSLCAEIALSNCDQEDEACCTILGECSDTTPGICILNIGGTPQGPGSNCANTICPTIPEFCETATVIGSLPFFGAADFSGTSDGPGGTCDNTFIGGAPPEMSGDLWWSYTATQDCSLVITVTSDGSGFFDPIIVVRDDCVALTELACSDVNTDNENETLAFPVVNGQTILIQAGDNGGFNDGTAGTISVNCAMPGFGACCIDANTCQDIDGGGEADCTTLFGGDYRGDGSSCATVDCAPPPACGVPGTGSCTGPDGATTGTGSLFCDDAACCMSVCAVDSFCCDPLQGGTFDELCQAEARVICLGDPSTACEFAGLGCFELTVADCSNLGGSPPIGGVCP